MIFIPIVDPYVVITTKKNMISYQRFVLFKWPFLAYTGNIKLTIINNSNVLLCIAGDFCKEVSLFISSEMLQCCNCCNCISGVHMLPIRIIGNDESSWLYSAEFIFFPRVVLSLSVTGSSKKAILLYPKN